MPTKRILVVDDDRNTRRALCRALESLDTEIIGAEDGETAIRIVDTEPIDLVLLDLRMPGIDGLAVLRELADRHREVPVAIVTAHGTIENAVEAMQLGAIDVMQKPFSLQEIREFVEQILQRERLTARGGAGYETLLHLARQKAARHHLIGSAESASRMNGPSGDDDSMERERRRIVALARTRAREGCRVRPSAAAGTLMRNEAAWPPGASRRRSPGPDR